MENASDRYVDHKWVHLILLSAPEVFDLCEFNGEYICGYLG